jgi:hypothetical protein
MRYMRYVIWGICMGPWGKSDRSKSVRSKSDRRKSVRSKSDRSKSDRIKSEVNRLEVSRIEVNRNLHRSKVPGGGVHGHGEGRVSRAGAHDE